MVFPEFEIERLYDQPVSLKLTAPEDSKYNGVVINITPEAMNLPENEIIGLLLSLKKYRDDTRKGIKPEKLGVGGSSMVADTGNSAVREEVFPNPIEAIERRKNLQMKIDMAGGIAINNGNKRVKGFIRLVP